MEGGVTVDKINEFMAQIYDFLEDLIKKVEAIFNQIKDMLNPQPLD